MIFECFALGESSCHPQTRRSYGLGHIRNHCQWGQGTCRRTHHTMCQGADRTTEGGGVCSLSSLCAGHGQNPPSGQMALREAARDGMGTFHQWMHSFLGPFLGSSNDNVFNCSSRGNINRVPWELHFFPSSMQTKGLRFSMPIQSLRRKCSHYFYLCNKYFIVFACLSEVELHSVHRLALGLRLLSAKITSSHPVLSSFKTKQKQQQQPPRTE